MSTNPKPKTTKEAAAEVLRHEGAPLTIDEIADRILKTGNIRLSGKTPKATISAQLYVEAKKPDGMFVKTGRGVIGLRAPSARIAGAAIQPKSGDPDTRSAALQSPRSGRRGTHSRS